MKNIEQGQQQKITRLLKRINIITILFVMTSSVYIYFNYRHLVATAGGEWGQALAPFIGSCIAIFNSFIVILVVVFLRKNHTRIATLKNDEELPLISYSAPFWAILMMLGITTDFIFRINRDFRSMRKDQQTEDVITENIQQDNLQGFLQSNWRCRSDKSMSKVYKKIMNVKNTDEIIKTTTLHTNDNWKVNQCFSELTNDKWIVEAIRRNATEIYYWQVNQTYETRLLKSAKHKDFNDWRFSTMDINTDTISVDQIKEHNTVLKTALAMEQKYYLDLLLDHSDPADRASFLQFSLLTNNEALFARLADKDPISIPPTTLAIAARYSNDNLYKKVIQLPLAQTDINKALVVAVSEKYGEKNRQAFDLGIKRLTQLGAQEIKYADRQNQLLALVPSDLSTESLQRLINSGANINAKNRYQKTLMARKIEIGDAEIESVKLLLINNADLLIKDENGKTPFHYLDDKRMEIAKLLINNNPHYVNTRATNGNTPLHSAISKGLHAKKVIIHLLENGADLTLRNESEETPFSLFSTSSMDNSLVELILKYGANIDETDSDGSTLLMRIVKYSDFQCIKNSQDKVQFLIDHGAQLDVMTNEQEPILEYANYNCIELLVANGLNINSQDAEGRTPLVRCLRNNYCHTFKVQALIDNGTQVNIKDHNGRQAIHYASSKEVLDILIANGADINAQDNLQDDLLHITNRKIDELKETDSHGNNRFQIEQATHFKKYILELKSQKIADKILIRKNKATLNED